jgi:hypothetical protein
MGTCPGPGKCPGLGPPGKHDERPSDDTNISISNTINIHIFFIRYVAYLFFILFLLFVIAFWILSHESTHAYRE